MQDVATVLGNVPVTLLDGINLIAVSLHKWFYSLITSIAKKSKDCK
jgi:hypothetical protein